MTGFENRWLYRSGLPLSKLKHGDEIIITCRNAEDGKDVPAEIDSVGVHIQPDFQKVSFYVGTVSLFYYRDQNGERVSDTTAGYTLRTSMDVLSSFIDDNIPYFFLERKQEQPYA